MVYIFYKKSKKIYLIRPLLIINRVEVLKLSFFWKLPLFVDLTNNLINFRRNRLRNQIFPILKIFFNPKIELAIDQFIKTANFEKNYFNYQLYKIKKFLKIQKLKNLSSKNRQMNNTKLLMYLPEDLKKLIYKHLLFFYFKDSLSYEFDFIIKLWNLK